MNRQHNLEFLNVKIPKKIDRGNLWDLLVTGELNHAWRDFLETDTHDTSFFNLTCLDDEPLSLSKSPTS